MNDPEICKAMIAYYSAKNKKQRMAAMAKLQEIADSEFSPVEDDPEDAGYKEYGAACNLVHIIVKSLPDMLRNAALDPIDGAYALWDHFSRILLDNGWAACDLSDHAHGIQTQTHEIDEEKEPEVTVQ